MPVKPSYVKFAKGTPSARFLKFCKAGTKENYFKKKARKNAVAPMPSRPNYEFLKVQPSRTFCCKPRLLKCP